MNGTEALAFIQAHPKVAIVGLGPKPDRPAYHVADFLQQQGFDITPVHPTATLVLGKPVKAGLAALQPGDVDWLDLFVSPDRLPGLLPEVLRLQPGLVWCQLGVVNPAFNQAVTQAGIPLIFDHCPKIEWNLHG